MTRSVIFAMRQLDRWRAILIVAAGLGVGSSTLAQAVLNSCGDLKNGYGPFDYRKDKDKLPIVENSHFTPPVEALIHGVSGPIGAELDYALRAFPNHHRVLAAMSRYGQKLKSPQPPGANYTIDCYFDRAIRFAADDNVVRMLFAQYLGRLGRTKEAIGQLEVASAQAKDDGFTHYNIGLVYFELGQPDRALAQAHRAMALGFERPELRQMLERAAKWRDPAN